MSNKLKVVSPKLRPIEKLIREISYTRGSCAEVFDDVIGMLAMGMNSLAEPRKAERHLQSINKIKARYDEDALEKIAQIYTLLGQLYEELSETPVDLLGHLYMEMELGNKYHGQEFTPDSVCQLCAALTSGDLKPDKTGIITINDPACGSGNMLLAMIHNEKGKGINTSRYLCFGTDVDIRCVWMAYIQTFFYGIPAVIFHGNTITYEMWETWITPQAIPLIHCIEVNGGNRK